MDDKKICTQCGETKPLTYFFTDKEADDGRMEICRRCHINNPGVKKSVAAKAHKRVKALNNGIRYSNKKTGEKYWRREDGKVIDLTKSVDEKGKFTKGNNYGKVSSKKAYSNSPKAAETKMAIKNAMSTDEAKELFQSLMGSKNDNVRLKALEMWLHYNYGKPTQHIEQDIKTSPRESLPAEVLALLDGTND